jgi:hypothetical protein
MVFNAERNAGGASRGPCIAKRVRCVRQRAGHGAARGVQESEPAERVREVFVDAVGVLDEGKTPAETTTQANRNQADPGGRFFPQGNLTVVRRGRNDVYYSAMRGC